MAKHRNELVQSAGAVIGMSGKDLNIVLTADSALPIGLGISTITQILEYNDSLKHESGSSPLPLPLACAFSYAALDFNISSWLSQDSLRILKEYQPLPDSLTKPWWHTGL
ncbi:hypothetical protein BT96DRAFT_997173 [Gymnopus androsaceus JB14]|uniref:Uncharacterized protein n=1 Tax=Gymnopus androsaceus JB14 TaxID=1447944 RepID=A0A6A4HFK4_9AGAR|nr:hypothetical protein BT96DRAFT_997173 [Gymnopus androsaceus JB14]